MSPLGPLTVTAADGAIVALGWGEAGCGLLDPLVQTAVEELEAYFEGRLRAFTLPLKPAGTAFQRRVWAAIAVIPCGETRSYGALAAELGSGPRAVARACATNPIPLLIPCHRIIGADGRLTGYSGGSGIDTKAWLLQHEGAAVTIPPRLTRSLRGDTHAARDCSL
jgi:methylated-DNA-[protein]-cysteine S-methyltransferase